MAVIRVYKATYGGINQYLQADLKLQKTEGQIPKGEVKFSKAKRSNEFSRKTMQTKENENTQFGDVKINIIKEKNWR